MLFWIPDPTLWDDPGPVPYSKWLRRLARSNFFPTREQWIEQYRTYYNRLQQIEEETARYYQQLAEYETLMAAYEEQGEHMAEMLPIYLHKLGLSYKRTVQDRKHEGRFFERVEYCKIAGWHFDEHAYYFQIDTSDLPPLVRIRDFLDSANWDTLSSNFNSKTTIEHKLRDPERPGLWVIVEHRAGRGLVPSYVEYSRLYKAIPKTAPPLTFPVGVGANSTARFVDMDEIYTVGVFGQKGSGKSNSINVMICTWIQRARPDELRLFLTDLKGALEFFNYNGIPHLGGDVDHKMKLSDDSPAEPVRLGLEVLSEPHQVAPVLEYMEKEMARRQKLMQGRARKISAYNRKVKKPLSRWILVIDELATLADSEHKKGCYKSLAELIRKGRAVGLYVVLATQIPDKTVLTRQIAGNLDFRVVGFLPDGASSALTLGDGSWDATRLNPEVHGRMIAKWNEKNIIQAPFINDLTIDRIIKAVKTGQATVDTEETAMADEIFTYALEDLGGLCSHRELYKHFKNRYSDHRIRNLLKQWEVRAVEDGKGLEPVITLADMEYYLLPATRDGNNGRIPRQLLSLPDFEKKRGEWIEIIASRTWQVAHGTKNSRGVDGQSSKVSKAVEANQAN